MTAFRSIIVVQFARRRLFIKMTSLSCRLFRVVLTIVTLNAVTLWSVAVCMFELFTVLVLRLELLAVELLMFKALTELLTIVLPTRKLKPTVALLIELFELYVFIRVTFIKVEP